MRALLLAVLASGLVLTGCGQTADRSSALARPAAPTSGVKSDSQAASAPAAKTVEVPFHSELVWTKVEGSLTRLCTRPLPAGKVYLQRNTILTAAVSTHLGEGEYEGHTCVYGTTERGASLVALDEALTALASVDPRKSQVVELRYFAGPSVTEAAAVLGVSPETVQRDWRVAKAWLLRELSNGGAPR